MTRTLDDTTLPITHREPTKSWGLSSLSSLNSQICAQEQTRRRRMRSRGRQAGTREEGLLALIALLAHFYLKLRKAPANRRLCEADGTQGRDTLSTHLSRPTAQPHRSSALPAWLAIAVATLTVPVVNFHMCMQSEHPAS